MNTIDIETFKQQLYAALEKLQPNASRRKISHALWNPFVVSLELKYGYDKGHREFWRLVDQFEQKR